MRQYVPMPRQSGYDDTMTEFQFFCKNVESDFTILSNAIYSITGQQFGVTTGENQAALPPSTPSMENNATIMTKLFQLRQEITFTLERF